MWWLRGVFVGLILALLGSTYFFYKKSQEVPVLKMKLSTMESTVQLLQDSVNTQNKMIQEWQDESSAHQKRVEKSEYQAKMFMQDLNKQVAEIMNTDLRPKSDLIVPWAVNHATRQTTEWESK